MPFFNSRISRKDNGEAFEGIAVVAIVHVPDAHAGIKQHGAVRFLNQAADDLLEIIPPNAGGGIGGTIQADRDYSSSNAPV